MTASAFAENSHIIYNEKFEQIFIKIVACYQLMKIHNVVLPNDENLIRDEIVNNYLMANTVRNSIGIDDYLFIRENPTNDNTGRTDISVVLRNDSFQNTNALYIIECKRLDGKIKLNREYITNGIARFIKEKKYPTYKNTAGMIGFVVAKIDISQNIIAINRLLKQDFTHIDTEKELDYKEIVSNFKYSYFSQHKIEDISKIIYHLMFDLSDHIKETNERIKKCN